MNHHVLTFGEKTTATTGNGRKKFYRPRTKKRSNI